MPASNINVFALLILLGAVQGFFLSFFFIFGKRKSNACDKILGLMLLSISFSMLEVFLCYSNLIVHTLWLVDFAEPFNFVFGPFYFVFAKIFEEKKFRKTNYLHFIPFFLYLVNAGFYLCQPYSYKYASFMSAYHPELPGPPFERFFDDNPLGIRNYVNELTIVHFLIYAVLSILSVIRTFKREGLRIFQKASIPLSFLRTYVFQFAALVLIFILIKLFFERDLGDFLICSYAAVTIYYLGFQALRNRDISNYSEHETKKYEKSGLTEEGKTIILRKVEELMKTEKYFKNNLLSLPDLSKRVNTTPNYLSQVLNEKVNLTFFDYIANLRIEEAKKLLQENSSLKIEEIAEMVGYNSKSGFNTAFKKITGKTPSEFKKTTVMKSIT
jgi:AraC-like DNA-binding protein